MLHGIFKASVYLTWSANYPQSRGLVCPDNFYSHVIDWAEDISSIMLLLIKGWMSSPSLGVIPSYPVSFECQKRAQLLLLPLHRDLYCQRCCQPHPFLIIMHATLRSHRLHMYSSHVPVNIRVRSSPLSHPNHRLVPGSPPPQQRPAHLASLKNQQTPTPTKQTLASRAKHQKEFEKISGQRRNRTSIFTISLHPSKLRVQVLYITEDKRHSDSTIVVTF